MGDQTYGNLECIYVIILPFSTSILLVANCTLDWSYPPSTCDPHGVYRIRSNSRPYPYNHPPIIFWSYKPSTSTQIYLKFTEFSMTENKPENGQNHPLLSRSLRQIFEQIQYMWCACDTRAMYMWYSCDTQMVYIYDDLTFQHIYAACCKLHSLFIPS